MTRLKGGTIACIQFRGRRGRSVFKLRLLGRGRKAGRPEKITLETYKALDITIERGGFGYVTYYVDFPCISLFRKPSVVYSYSARQARCYIFGRVRLLLLSGCFAHLPRRTLKMRRGLVQPYSFTTRLPRNSRCAEEVVTAATATKNED